MRKLFIVALFPIFMGGCSLFQGGLVKKYDAFTVDQIDKTIAYENAVMELLNRELTAFGVQNDPTKIPTLIESAKLEVKVRHDGEIARLASWRMVESAKEGAPKPIPVTGGGK